LIRYIVHEEEKASLESLMMLRKYKQNRRGKPATAVTAAIWLEFAKKRLSSTFLDAAVVTTARASCRMNPAELRERRNSEPTHSVKLPISEDIIQGMRARLWDGLSWCDEDKDKEKRMRYLGCMWGFEMGAGVSEYTRAEQGKSDHCIRLDDLTFLVEDPNVTQTLSGGCLAATGVLSSAAGLRQISECRVLGTSSKAKVAVKPKLLARRSDEDAQFLEDLAIYVIRSGARGRDGPFSFRKLDGTEVPLRSRTIRDELKKTCEIDGLPSAYFSSHTLRKGAITHMSAAGATEEDRRDRGNYSAGSQVMNQTYDYAVGLGPLASNSLPGARRLGLRDVKLLIPAARSSL
jgi:hypothetical protein